jgi:hypothetical protein
MFVGKYFIDVYPHKKYFEIYQPDKHSKNQKGIEKYVLGKIVCEGKYKRIITEGNGRKLGHKKVKSIIIETSKGVIKL